VKKFIHEGDKKRKQVSDRSVVEMGGKCQELGKEEVEDTKKKGKNKNISLWGSKKEEGGTRKNPSIAKKPTGLLSEGAGKGG